MFRKRVGVLLASTILVGSLAVGCGSNGGSEKITVSGSTSVGPLMEVIAEDFQSKNEGISVEIQQLGSSAGIKNTIDGTSEIGMASRDLKEEEKSAGLTETEIAIDAIAIVTNKNNEVKDLTVQQIKDIYTGKITNWKEVGGEDAQIVLVSREEGSGTRDGFQDILGFESADLVKDAQICDGSGAVKSTIEGNKNAIGYISFGYVKDGIKSVKINGVEANDDNVLSGDYVISRPFLLTNKKGNLSETAKSFVDFILSEEGQNIVSEEGFIKAN